MKLAPSVPADVELSIFIPPHPFPEVSMSVTVKSEALFTTPYPLQSFIVTPLSSTFTCSSSLELVKIFIPCLTFSFPSIVISLITTFAPFSISIAELAPLPLPEISVVTFIVLPLPSIVISFVINIVLSIS